VLIAIELICLTLNPASVEEHLLQAQQQLQALRLQTPSRLILSNKAPEHSLLSNLALPGGHGFLTMC
jgi:hypothetical protein